MGVGTGFVRDYLLKCNIPIETIDIDEKIKSNHHGNIQSTSFRDNEFDLINCCQVLEHMPYDSFKSTLEEMRRITKSYVLISLPDLSRKYSFQIELPLFGKVQKIIPLPRLKKIKWEYNGEHYWNIGVDNYSLARIILDIENSGFSVVKTYCVFEYNWHRFFLLEKK